MLLKQRMKKRTKMTTAASLVEIATLIKDHFPNSEFCASGKRVFFSFSEKAYESMHIMDIRFMTRSGWSYDKNNDCWSIFTE